MSSSRTIILAATSLFLLLSLLGCSSTTDRQIAQLRDSDPDVRRGAARALKENRVCSADVIAALTQAAKDSDVEVRKLAASALGRFGPAAKSSVPVLEQVLADEDLSIRFSAALAIQKIEPQNQSYIPAILESLNAGFGTVFLEVGRMGPEAKWAVPTLTKLLSHPQPGIRALAAQTLGQIGPAASETGPTLKRASHDAAPAVQKAAERALDQIQGQSRP